MSKPGKQRCKGGICETEREKGIRVDRWGHQLEFNKQCKSLVGIMDKGQGEQSYDSELWKHRQETRVLVSIALPGYAHKTISPFTGRFIDLHRLSFVTSYRVH
jgi:hypothetical protein